MKAVRVEKKIKIRSGKNLNKFGKLKKKKKSKRIAKMLYFRSESILKLRKIFFTKHSVVYKYFDFFKFLVFKKEFFIFKNFYLKFKLLNNINILLFPHFVFEKQFLFKFSEYQNLIYNSSSDSFFLKHKYNLPNLIDLKKPGLNYLINTKNNIENTDPKDPIFYLKNSFYNEKNTIQNNDLFSIINFNYQINYNMFFFIMIDIYKIVLFLNFKNSN